ncbi:hypothetical protein J3F83DRAFT_239780 [Trichoderma novae-zelandiae]
MTCPDEMNDPHRDTYRFNDNKTFITVTMKKAAAMSSKESLPRPYEKSPAALKDGEEDGTSQRALRARLRIMDKILAIRSHVRRIRLRLRKSP